MRPRIIFALLVIAGLFACAISRAVAQNGLPTRLLQAADFTYIGGARTPNVEGYSYSSSGLAFNPLTRSLFISGHVYYGLVAEIRCQTYARDYAQMPFCDEVQPLSDILEGHGFETGINGSICDQTTYTGGLHVFNGTLLGTRYVYYDAGFCAARSHFRSGLTLSTQGDFQGLFTVGTVNPGYVAGYMADVPLEWQSSLGGPVLTGQAALAIISRSSQGPSAFAFDPAQLGATAAPAHALVYYPADHPTLGAWDNQSVAGHLYNMATGIYGVVFPRNTATVIFLVTRGTGVPCYGAGTADASLIGTFEPDGITKYCYDPINASKGGHAYPYENDLYLYDATRLAAVARGELQPWDPTPYAVINAATLGIDVSGGTGLGFIGATYDADSNQIILGQSGCAEWLTGNAGAYSCNPLLRVLQISPGPSEPPPPPPPPPADTLAPTVTLKASRNGNSSNFTVVSTATDNVAVTWFQVALDGSVFARSPLTCANGCIMKIPVRGMHQFKAEATDAAGNYASVTQNVTR